MSTSKLRRAPFRLQAQQAHQLGHLLGHRLGHGSAVKEQTAEEQSQALSDEVEGNARDGLIGLEGDGGHCVQQSQQTACQTRCQEADPGAGAVIASCRTGKGTDHHHAFQADVDDAGALTDDAAQRR